MTEPRAWLPLVFALWIAAVAVRIAWAEDLAETHSPALSASSGAPGTDSIAHERVAPVLYLSRVCFLEATWRHEDCTAIAWIARKRAARVGRPWIEVLRRYSVLDRQLTERAREVATYPDADVPGKSARFNREWAALREHARRLVAGDVPDNCPEALHWGGVTDLPREGMVLAVCAGQGATANRLYAVGGER